MTVRVVQHKPAQTTSAAPSVTLDATPTQGNVLMFGWRAATTLANMTPPAGFLTLASDQDDAGGFSSWIGYKPVGNGTAALVSFASAASVVHSIEVVEVGGIAVTITDGNVLVASVDTAPAASDPAGSSTSVPCTSTGALAASEEFVFAMAGVSGAVTAPAVDSGFTLLDSGTLTTALVGYKITAATTALAPTFSWTTARGRNALIGSFPAQTKPLPVVQVGFGSNPGTAIASTAYTDISDKARAVSMRRGRSAETDDFRPGTATVVLANADRTFDPNYTAGAYYGQLLPLRPIRIGASWGGTLYWLFYGFVLGWPQEYDPPNDAHVALQCVDAFEVLAQKRAPRSPYAVEVLADSPKAWWRLGDDAGSTVAVDSIGNYSGTYDGSPTLGTTGLIAQDSDTAATFNGTSVVNSIPLAAALSGTTFTVEGWIQRDTTTVVEWVAGQYQVDRDALLYPFGWAITIGDPGTGANGLLYGHVKTTDTANASVNTAVRVDDGLPHHCCITYTGSTLTLYVDGVAVDTSGTGGASCGSGLIEFASQIALEYSSDGGYAGILDDVAIYTTALSAARVLAHYNAGRSAWSGEGSGARVSRVLDAVSWPSADRNVDTGQSTLGPQPLDDAALAVLKTIEASEQGRVYITRAGLVRFEDRYGVLTNAVSTTVQATFGDGNGTELPYKYDGFRLRYDRDTIRNSVTGQRDGGAELTETDSASSTAYLTRSFSLPALVSQSDNDVLSLLQYQLDRYAQPFTRIDGITVMPASAPGPLDSWTADTLWAAVLGAEISQRYTIKRRPQSVGSVISLDVLLEGVSHSFGPAFTDWETGFYLSPADTRSYWVLGTSALDTGTRLAF